MPERKNLDIWNLVSEIDWENAPSWAECPPNLFIYKQRSEVSSISFAAIPNIAVTLNFGDKTMRDNHFDEDAESYCDDNPKLQELANDGYDILARWTSPPQSGEIIIGRNIRDYAKKIGAIVLFPRPRKTEKAKESPNQ